MEKSISFQLNGKKTEVTIDPALTLLWVLRNHFGLTGTKFGCGMGFCGSCTVLVDREAVRSCSVSVGDIAGKNVITIEGLATDGKLHPLQKAFIDHDALQCGYCTPGMVMSCAALLEHHQDPSEDDIRTAISGHFCRCGTYPHVVEATLAAAKARKI